MTEQVVIVLGGDTWGAPALASAHGSGWVESPTVKGCSSTVTIGTSRTVELTTDVALPPFRRHFTSSVPSGTALPSTRGTTVIPHPCTRYAPMCPAQELHDHWPGSRHRHLPHTTANHPTLNVDAPTQINSQGSSTCHNTLTRGPILLHLGSRLQFKQEWGASKNRHIDDDMLPGEQNEFHLRSAARC